MAAVLRPIPPPRRVDSMLLVANETAQLCLDHDLPENFGTLEWFFS